MKQDETDLVQKGSTRHYCDMCDYITCRKSQYSRHILTRKHRMKQNETEIVLKSSTLFTCDKCNQTFNSRTTMWRHLKKCDNSNKTEIINPRIDSTMVLELIKQNKELQAQIINLTQTKPEVQITSNTNSNTNNFNISVFLNEHCKNAINFSDFINNIQVSREDLQNNAQLGFVGGISKIITDNLKLLTVHERPIHCTDVKRETLYIRDDNSWKKDKDFVQERLNQAIQEVSRKSVVSLMEWKQTNPDYKDMDSDFSNLCLVMHQQSIAGYDRDKFYPKVIRRIAESVPCKGH